VIILASASPRRQEILRTAGYDFTVRVMDIDEEKITATSKEELVMKLSREKALACRKSCDDLEDGDIIIGADTLVFAKGKRLGKPADEHQWKEYIQMLQGDVHEVITGVTLIGKNQEKSFYSTTRVSVSPMTDEDIEEYVLRGEDIDKAGGYAIQGYFAKYIPQIDGEYNNVVGFPIAKFREEMAALCYT